MSFNSHHPVSKAGYSLLQQASWRLLAVMGLVLVILLSGQRWLNQANQEMNAREVVVMLARHFQESLSALEQQDRQRLVQVKNRLEARQGKTGRGDWSWLAEVNEEGVLALFDDKGSLLITSSPLSLPWQQVMGVSWYQEGDKGWLWHIQRQEVNLGQSGKGQLLWLRPLEDDLLANLAFPDTDLFLVWQNRILASSLGEEGRQIGWLLDDDLVRHQEPSLRAGRLSWIIQGRLPWRPGPGQEPWLVFQHHDQEGSFWQDLILPGLIFFILSTILLWATLGGWVWQLTQRVVWLRQAAGAFRADHTLSAAFHHALDKAAGRTADEIQQVAHTVLQLAEAMEEREEIDRRAYQNRAIINAILELGLGNQPLSDKLHAALPIILQVPWLALQGKGVIFLANEDGTTLHKAAQFGLGGMAQQCALVRLGECLCGSVAVSRQPLFVTGVDERHQFSYEGMADHGHYVLPMVAEEQVLGVLTLYVNKGHVHRREEEEFLTTVAKTLAHIVQHETVKEKREQEAANRVIIHRLLETALHAMPVVRQLETLLDILFSTPWFHFLQKGAVFLVDEKSGHLVLQAHRGYAAPLLQQCSRVKAGWCLCGKALQRGEILFASHVDGDHDYRYEGMEDHGHYCIPLKKDDQVLGVLTLYVRAGHVPGQQEAEFLQTLAMTAVSLIEKSRLEEKIRLQAEYDSLTGLPNRTLFLDRLGQAIVQAERNRGEVVVMFIDVDRFKQVNDSLGHTAGDGLLQEVARRILACVRSTDTVARLGGDEFTVILPKLTHLFYVEYVARRILEGLRQPLVLQDQTFNITGSMGITVYPHDGTTVETLLKNADTAMYAAKEQGRDGFRFFSEEMSNKAVERMALEQAIKRGLEREEFFPHFQPKVDRHGRVVGMEALARWQRPESGLTYPGDFIAVAEQSGLIVGLGQQILFRACQQTATWVAQGLGELLVSVNLSARQLRLGEGLVEVVKNCLAQTGLPAHCLELEVTESMMMENIADVRQILDKIRTLGVKLSIDDFGTGYSSLSVLRHLPIQTLKIDRSFIRGVDLDADSRVLVSAIIAMARQLGLYVVAEGVETAEEKDIVFAEGCDAIQGYYYSKPVAADRFAAYVRQHLTEG